MPRYFAVVQFHTQQMARIFQSTMSHYNRTTQLPYKMAMKIPTTEARVQGLRQRRMFTMYFAVNHSIVSLWVLSLACRGGSVSVDDTAGSPCAHIHCGHSCYVGRHKAGDERRETSSVAIVRLGRIRTELITGRRHEEEHRHQHRQTCGTQAVERFCKIANFLSKINNSFTVISSLFNEWQRKGVNNVQGGPKIDTLFHTP